MESNDQKPLAVYSVSSTDSPEFTHFTRALSRASVVGLDAEWKPLRSQHPTFPTVSLLQVACRLRGGGGGGDDDDATSNHSQGVSLVFLLDLQVIHLPSIYGLLKDVFVSPDILKLGFRFKQDLVYLSSTFCAQGCNPGFDRVEPFMDITSVYNHLQTKQSGRMASKLIKSLAAICKEVLNITLSKELQCSDWSCRPLTEEQKAYAAEDAHCLLKLFFVFQTKVMQEGNQNASKIGFSFLDLGLKEILQEPINKSDTILRTKFGEALNIVRASATSVIYRTISTAFRKVSIVSSLNTAPMDDFLLHIVMKFGDKILLKDSEKKPKAHRKKGRRKPSGGSVRKGRESLESATWEGPPPWEISLGGDGCPKFLCDVMVEGLAKHLRCVGIDAAIPHSRKPDTRELIDQAQREERVLLTRDAKLLRHGYLIQNQIYRVKSLLKNEQLLEVIGTFKLKISEDRLMSRCTKCNGMFIQKPLSTEEAVEAAKGFQVIPNCLFDKDLQFWQCMDCNQLYWEGTQYHNAVQKFIDVCKLNDQPEVI